MKLPNIEARYVPVGKARDYLLDTAHDEGGPKAAFLLQFGFRQLRFDVLVDALMRHPIDHPVHDTQPHPYGRVYRVQGRLKSPDGADPVVRTVWLIRDDGRPQLLTAVPA